MDCLNKDEEPEEQGKRPSLPAGGSRLRSMSMKQTLDMFVAPGDMTPNTAAVFVAEAAEQEAKNPISPSRCSPNRQFFMERNRFVNNLFDSVVPERVKNLMKLGIAKTYVEAYRRQKAIREETFVVPAPSTNPNKRKLLDFGGGCTPTICSNSPPTTGRAKRRATTVTPQKRKGVPAVVCQQQEMVAEQQETGTNNQNEDDETEKKKRPRIKWCKVQGIEFDSINDAKCYLQREYPSFGGGDRSKSLPEREGVGKFFEYKCGMKQCKARLCLVAAPKNVQKKPAAEGVIAAVASLEKILLKIQTNKDCNCTEQEREENNKKQGLPEVAKKHVDNAMAQLPHAFPKKIISEVMTVLTEEDGVDMDGPDARQLLKEQLQRRVQYKKELDRNKKMEDGGTGSNRQIKCVFDLMELKEKCTFSLPKARPDDNSSNLSTEVEVKEFGSKLYDSEHLKTFAIEKIKDKRSQCHRFFTVLDGSIDPTENDELRSPAEKKIYQRIAFLQKKHKGKYTAAWEQTTVFSSLVLLWNLKQCADLDFCVTASADGTAKTHANDYKLLSFGCFSVDERKSGIIFRPFIYIICPEEAEIFFAIGVCALLKYARRLFGITKVHFKGGVVSDHAASFVNVFKEADLGVPMQCYPHLWRKFSNSRKGTLFVGRTKQQYMLC